MNKQILLIVISVFILMFSLIVGCGNDSGTNSNEVDNPFVGKWTCIERNGSPLGVPGKIQLYYTFLRDSTFVNSVSYPSGVFGSQDGEYRYNQDSIALAYPGVPVHIVTYGYKRNLGKLILSREYEELILAPVYGN